MGIFISQNPGIGGIDELTDSEALFIQQMVGASRNNGDVLTIASGLPTWAAPSGGGGTPGGSTTQLQFNDAGVFGGSAKFTFDKTTGALTLAAGSTGAISLNAAGTSSTGNILIGSRSDTPLMSLQAINVSIRSNSTGSITLGDVTTSGTITLGDTGTTGTISIGIGTTTNTVNIASGTIATGNTQNVNIGASVPTGTGNTKVQISNSKGFVGINKASTTTSGLSIGGLPTSSAGLSTGDVWVDTAGGLNILKIV